MSPSRNRVRPFAIAMAIGIGLSSALVPTSAPAEVVVSADGILYTHEVSGLLDSGVLVPLGTTTDTFSVRSGADTPGYLRVVLSDVTTSDPALPSALTVAASTPALAGHPIPLAQADPCAQLLTAVPLSPGQSVTISTSVAMGDLPGTVGQNGTFSFRLQVILSEVVQDSDACAGVLGGGSGTLSSTGGAIPVLAVAVGVAALTAGAVAIGVRRKRADP